MLGQVESCVEEAKGRSDVSGVVKATGRGFVIGGKEAASRQDPLRTTIWQREKPYRLGDGRSRVLFSRNPDGKS